MAALLQDHLDVIVCPVCHATLKAMPTTIACTGCGREYPIVDGLPVLIGTRGVVPPEKP